MKTTNIVWTFLATRYVNACNLRCSKQVPVEAYTFRSSSICRSHRPSRSSVYPWTDGRRLDLVNSISMIKRDHVIGMINLGVPGVFLVSNHIFEDRVSRVPKGTCNAGNSHLSRFLLKAFNVS